HARRWGVAEQLERVSLVDVADEALVDAVPAQPGQAAVEAPGDGARDAELLVLLLADVPGAVVAGDAHAALARRVGAAPVPQAAVPLHDAAPRPLRTEGDVDGAEIGRRTAHATRYT